MIKIMMKMIIAHVITKRESVNGTDKTDIEVSIT